MKVPVKNRSINTMTPLYKSILAKNSPGFDITEEDINTDTKSTGKAANESSTADTLLISKKEDSPSEESIIDAASNHVSCSIPDDSTGQLAAMLARAETKMDVQQVSSKAVRALSALKMASVFAEGDDAKKVTQRIRRMEKLISRISKKQQQLNKEEVLELQRKSAEKRKEMKRAQEIKNELDTKRTKRRRDERNYASKELAQDEKEASQEMIANMTGASSSSVSAPDSTVMAGLASAATELSVTEDVSLDITV